MNLSSGWWNNSSTTFGLTVNYSTKVGTAVFGVVTCISNFILLIYIFRLIELSIKRRDSHSLFIHFFSICINDALCGVAVFVIAVMYVEGAVSTHICAYTIFFSIALQNVSQGNIACISLQRYVSARNIHTTLRTWQSNYTKTLVVVNIVVAVVSFIVHIFEATVRMRPLYNSYCNLHNIVEEDVLVVVKCFYVLGIPFTCVSNILCILTVLRLRTRTSIVPDSQDSSTVVSHSMEQARVQKRQAITTIVLILVVLNISFLPSVITLFWKLAGKFLSADVQRIVFMTMSINSLFNPFIILCRTQSIKDMIKHDLGTLYSCCR